MIPLKKTLGKCTCLLRLTRQHKFKHIGCWLQDSVRIAHRRVRVLGTVRCDGGLSKIQSASNFICIKGLSLSLSPCYGMRFNSLFAPFEFLVHSVRSGGQDSMQHGTVVAWKKQLEYTAARSNIHWRSSQNVHKCGPIKPNTCTFFLHDERNPANLHAWEAFCCHTAGCHDATHVRPSCLGVPSIQGSPNYNKRRWPNGIQMKILGYGNGCFSLLFPTQSLGSLARIAVCPARPKPRPCVKLNQNCFHGGLKSWNHEITGLPVSGRFRCWFFRTKTRLQHLQIISNQLTMPDTEQVPIQRAGQWAKPSQTAVDR